MAKKKISKKKVSKKKVKSSMTLAIISLLLNIFVPLGIGSLLGGRTKDGIWQATLFVLSMILMYFFSYQFIAVAFVAWIWGIITGIKLIWNVR